MHFRYVTETQDVPEIIVKLRDQSVLAVDIETAAEATCCDRRAGLDPYKSRPRLFSVAALNDIYVFDMQRLAPACLNTLAGTPWVAHNALFEWRHLTHHGYRLPTRLHDTQLMARPIHNGTLSLADLARLELGMDLDKTQQVSDWSGPLSEAQLEYAATDASVTLKLAYRLLDKLNQTGQGTLYELYRDVVPVIGRQMLTGLNIDWLKHQQLCLSWSSEKDRLEAELLSHMGKVNPRSPKQVSEWLSAHVPKAIQACWPRTASGCMSTSASALSLHSELPLVAPLLRFKAIDKLLGTFGKGYANHRHTVTDNLHPSLLIAGTTGGRFACRNPNVQNPPRRAEFRELFCAEPGRVLVAADFSQIELRVAALLSKDARMMAAYEQGQDLHRVTAAAIAGVSQDAITPEQRQAAKAINFGNLYQQRPAGLARYARNSYGVDMSIKQAADAQDGFFKAYPELRHWQRCRIQEARVYGEVATRMNLKRDFRERRGYLEAEACNHPIQGSAGEILLSALGKLTVHLDGLDARLYNHIHDEIILSVAAVDEVPAMQALAVAMADGFLTIFPEGEGLLEGLVEVKAGHSWADVK